MGFYNSKHVIARKDHKCDLCSDLASAYAPYFVSGGKLLSGETETTIRPLAMPVDSSKPFPVGGISGSDKGIDYRINLLRGKRRL